MESSSSTAAQQNCPPQNTDEMRQGRQLCLLQHHQQQQQQVVPGKQTARGDCKHLCGAGTDGTQVVGTHQDQVSACVMATVVTQACTWTTMWVRLSMSSHEIKHKLIIHHCLLVFADFGGRV
jgi:hypothetical protein